MRKGTKLYSIIKGKCPYCHEGEFFLSHSYMLKTMGDIYEKCKVCGGIFVPETGFYFGALYVSYALGVAFMVSVIVAFNVLGIELELFAKIATVSVLWLLLSPKMHALSKIILANFFMKYKQNINFKNK